MIFVFHQPDRSHNQVASYAELRRQVRGLRGKVVVVDFWAAWCVPCKREFPTLVRLHQKYARDGFAAVSVHLDGQAKVPREKVEKFLLRQDAAFLNLVLDAPAAQWQKKLKIDGPPCVYVFDRANRIVKKWPVLDARGRMVEGVDYSAIGKLVAGSMVQDVAAYAPWSGVGLAVFLLGLPSAPALSGPTRTPPAASSRTSDPPPAPTVCTSNICARNGIPATAPAKNKKAAWLFLQWVCGKDQLAEVLRTGSGTPARLSVYERDDLVANSSFPKEWFETTGTSLKLARSGLPVIVPVTEGAKVIVS